MSDNCGVLVLRFKILDCTVKRNRAPDGDLLAVTANSGQSNLVVHRIPDDRARHAMTAAATTAELRPDNGDHLDAFLA